jgi:class 3 adenylate cyclase
MQLLRHISYCLLAFILLAFSSCNKSNRHPQAQKGVLDISALNIEKEGLIKLDGQWEFYWQQLYEPKDFAAGTATVPSYIEVPVFWNTQKIDGKKLPAFGYATYHLKVKKQATAGYLGIKLPDPNSAYRLWINGQEIASAGKPGRTKQEEDPRLYPSIKSFAGNETELDIVLQVSNFFHHKAGIWQCISIGTEDHIQNDHENSLLLSMLLVGAYFILAVYNFFIFILRRSEYSALTFGFLSLCFSIRTFVIDERPILLFIPNISTDVMHRIQYESIFAACMLVMGFLYTITHTVFSKKVLKFFIWLSVAELVVICFTPVNFYTSLLQVFQLKVFVQAIFNYIAIVKSIRMRIKRAWLLFFLLGFILFSGVNDVLFTNAVIHTGYKMQYYCFLILVTQAYIVATRISGAYFKFSGLTQELNNANIGLEVKVAQRTLELETEKEKAENLLLNILPAKAAHELKTHGHSEAQLYEMTTVMLVDMVGFTKVSEQISAELLVAEIDECFKAFDAIVETHNIEKIKTIGDAYLCVGGIPEPNDTHAVDVLNAAIRINEFMARRYKQKELDGDVSFRIRIGIHSGPLVAGIVGSRKFSYDIWGDTVSITGDMEQCCEADKVNISSSTYELIRDKFKCTYRGEVQTKDGQMLPMYFLETAAQEQVNF